MVKEKKEMSERNLFRNKVSPQEDIRHGDEERRINSMRDTLLLLARIGILPVKLDPDTGNFRFQVVSRQSLVTFLMLLLAPLLWVAAILMDIGTQPEKFEVVKRLSTVDKYTIGLVTADTVLNPILIFFIAQYISIIEEDCPAIWPTKFKWPFILYSTLLFTFKACIFIPMLTAEMNPNNQIAYLLSIVESVLIIITLLSGSIVIAVVNFIFAGWITGFTFICGNTRMSVSLAGQAEQLVRVYGKLSNVVGMISFYVFSACQLLITFALYGAVSNWMVLEENEAYVVQAYGSKFKFYLITFGFAGIPGILFMVIYLIISLANDAVTAFKNVIEPIDAQMEVTADIEERLKLKKLHRDISNTGVMTGMDFFNVERSTIVSMVSTTVTYLIILVQFKQSEIDTSAADKSRNCTGGT